MAQKPAPDFSRRVKKYPEMVEFGGFSTNLVLFSKIIFL